MSDAENSRALGCLGIARKAGLVVTGEQNTGALAHDGRAKLIILAADASPNAQRRAEGFSASSGVPLAHVRFTKAEIAAATGRSGCSMAAFTDAGLALRFYTASGGADATLISRLSADVQRKKPQHGGAQPEREQKIGKRRKSV